MSNAAAAAPAEGAAPPKSGKKKLIIIVAAVLVLVLGGGGAAVFMMKKNAAEAEAAAAEGGEVKTAKKEKKKEKKDDKAVPVFVPLEPFTVNLADRETERYAQVGVTLEVDELKTGDKLKAYMPAIRNNILMSLAQKTAADLQSAEGKAKLAREIRREALRPLGVELEDEEDDADDDPKKKKRKRRSADDDAPIVAVHFSNFIIQ